MTKCYVCNRKGSKSTNLSFHRFPNDKESRQKWIEIIGKSDPPPVKRSTVCSIHFTEDCFRYGLVYGMRRLKEGSIPSLFLNETSADTIMLNKLHKTSVSQTLDEVINKFRYENTDDEESDEHSVTFLPVKLKTNHKRKAIESFKEESSAPKREIKLNLTWDKIISAPGGGRRYWEYAQGELITRKKE